MSIKKARWITLIIQIIIGTVTAMSYVVSVYIGPLADGKGWMPAIIVMVFTFAMWVGTPANIIGGILRDKFGCKKTIIGSGLLYGLSLVASGLVPSAWAFAILQGVLASTCMYFTYIAALANIGVLFPENKGTMTGIYVAGYSLGQAAMPPIAEFLIRTTSVTTSIVLQGAVYGLIVVVLGFFIVDPSSSAELEEEGEEEGIPSDRVQLNWRQVLRSPAFYFIELALLFIGIMAAIIMANGAPLAEQAVGASTKFAAWAVSLINIGSSIGGFVFGFIADRSSGLISLMIAGAVQAAACLVFIICGMGNAPVFLVVAMIVGLGCGGFGTLMPVIAMENFGEIFFGVNMGLITIQAMIGSFVGPQIAVRSSCTTTFAVGVITSIIGMIFVPVAIKAVRKMQEDWANGSIEHLNEKMIEE